ncbi:hypothetical protein BM477_02605 [Boudabousia marimammalium]|uniref:G5 domain-containing protein n=1 Tax=Boudabousia marimammalium TaxID=156892 RepID=A0A1Q5PSG6_9ACTO|nr:hypothetical protein BM477_02605 [Boudabousia marimammalium]
MLGISAFGVVSGHHDLVIEVDGVSRPVTVWGSSVSDALNAADIKVNQHDEVTPSLDSDLLDGSRIQVLTSRQYTVNVDGQRVELWSTARNSSEILNDFAATGRNVTISATRGSERSPLSTLSQSATHGTLVVDGESRPIEIPAHLTVKQLLQQQNVETSPIDRVRISHENGKLTVKIERVTRGDIVTDTDIPFSTEEVEDDSLLKGTTKVKTAGVVGKHRKVVYRETVNGEVKAEVVVQDGVLTQPVTQVVLKGTKDPVAHASASASDAAVIADSGAAGTSPAGAQAIAQKMVSARGWGDDQFRCLVSLWNRESNWNYRAQNRSSGAYGIPQALPGGKMASAGADWRTNPATQISWGLGYIQGRYGTPCGALAHSHRVGWY